MSANKNLSLVVIDFMETIAHTFYMSERHQERRGCGFETQTYGTKQTL